MRCNAAEAFLERGVEPRLCQAQLAAEPGVQPGFQRGQPLFHLGVEAGEVELVQLSQISPISRVHGIGDMHISIPIESPSSPSARMNQSTSSFATFSPSFS